MNRSRRPTQNKQFVAGGVYDARSPYPSGTQQATQANPGTPSNQANQGNVRNQRSSVSQHNGSQQAAPLQPPPQPPQMNEDQHIGTNQRAVAEPQVKTEQMDVNKIDGSSLYDESGKLQYKNIFRSRKKSSVRTKEKRIRQNRQLRKTLIPKNALMALHEVAGISISEFTIDASSSGGFVAIATVNGKQYEGKGNSKISAKNNASEKALRDYILEKMREKPRARKTSVNNEEAMDTTEENNVENGNGTQDEKGGASLIDDVPMVNLASFAIYKLFVEWENEGYPVPELRAAHQPNGEPGSEGGSAESSSPAKQPKTPAIRTELPSNWESIHPSTLLCMMRPGLQYRDFGTVGEPPNVLQRAGVTVDNVEYLSSGRSKKIARRNVAVTVLNELFGTNLTKDGPCEEE